MTNLRKSALAPLTDPSAPSEAAEAPLSPADLLPPATPLPASEAASLSPTDAGGAFHPTEAQVRVKAKFWSKWAEQPLLNAETPTLAKVQAITGSAAIKGWWTRAGFQDWFLNTRVTDERLEYLLHLALSAAEDILLNTDPRTAGFRVSMIKTVAEMSGRMGQQRLAPVAAAAGRKAQIDSMSKDDLVKLLEGAGLRIERVLQVEGPAPTPQEKQQ